MDNSISIESLNLLLASISDLSASIFWVRSPNYKKQIYISPNYEKIYGVPCEQLYDNPESWSDNVIKTDQKYVKEVIKERYQNIIAKKNDIKPIYYKILLPSGKINFVKNCAFAINDLHGNTIAIYGFGESLPQREWEDSVENEKECMSKADRFALDFRKLMVDELKLLGNQDKNEENVKYIINDDTASQQPVQIHLTPREHECLDLMTRGKSSKEVGKILNLSPRTIESYIESIKRKFKCNKKMEVIYKLQKLGYVF